MNKKSIVPSILLAKGVKLFDGNSQLIKICEETDTKFNFEYPLPYLIIDSYPKRITKPEELTEMNSVKELERYNLILVRVPVDSHTKSHKSQRTMFIIINKEDLLSYHQIMKIIPRDHHLWFDKANNQVFISGKNAGFPHRDWQKNNKITPGRGPCININKN